MSVFGMRNAHLAMGEMGIKEFGAAVAGLGCEVGQSFPQQTRWVCEMVLSRVQHTLKAGQVITHCSTPKQDPVSSHGCTSKESFLSFCKLRIFSKFLSWTDNFLGSGHTRNPSPMSSSEVLILYWLSLCSSSLTCGTITTTHPQFYWGYSTKRTQPKAARIISCYHHG